MKRLLVAVLVLAGCASKAPQERPLPPGMVAIATFTAAADPVAGTFTIRTEPTAAGRARGMAALANTDVLVENDGAPWFDSALTHGCPAGTRTWGANVKVSSLLGDTVWLGGVYAEITNFSGPTGSEGCNSAVAPEGLSAEHGLWAYPTVGVSFPGPQSVTWAFGRVSSAAVNFSGRIVAAKMSIVDVLDLAFEGDQVVADNGTGMVYSSSEFNRLQFVHYDGTGAGVSMLINGRATSIAPAVSDGVIWATTEDDEVGIVTSDGTGAAFVAGGGALIGGIVPDPVVAGRAWFRSNEGSFIRRIDRAALGLGVRVDTSPYAPWGMAIGPDLNLYVTAPADNRILVYTTGASGGVHVDDFPTGSACSGPSFIMQGPGGRMWFGSKGNNTVCSFTSKSDIAPVNTASDPMQLAIGPDGNVWVAANGTSQVARMDATGPGYRITLPSANGAFGVTLGGGKLWAADVYGIYPIELDPDL